ncbi:MAG: cytochrome-c peroxidase [Gammaproteobacteria bacterium]|nr:cytochrome-c peroxidase [Gammaproteobacteria bacterium]
MVGRFWVGLILALLLSSCDVSDINGRQYSASKCEASGETLKDAREGFFLQCGFEPYDCDPVEGGWICSSEIIGSNAPSLISPPLVTPVYACTAHGSTLTDAKMEFENQCSGVPVDCDPLNDQWMCSSEKIGANAPSVMDNPLDTQLTNRIIAASAGVGISAFQLPDSEDFNAIPQDPNNPITVEKVSLGRLLFHDTAFALDGRGGEVGTWSCATCHHAAAGFKSGVRQGIGNGGIGFGLDGSERELALGFDATAEADSDLLPDLQPLASPTILNSAYQPVMLWNGQFGNGADSGVNAAVDESKLVTPGTPKEANLHRLSGIETQAIAGTGVHRLRFSEDSALQHNAEYEAAFTAAFPSGSDDILRDAGKAIAAFERTVLATRAPFQRWLRGHESALTDAEKRGAILFFGEAGCSDCHTGPALSSWPNASAQDMFFAIGFADFDVTSDDIHGLVDEATKMGRGGFTGEDIEKYKFKIPTLYNLADADVYGHGASFRSVRDVLDYKNRGVPQAAIPLRFLDSRFGSLNLAPSEVDDLELFLLNALRDPELLRYQPASVPSGQCVVVDDSSARHLCP